MSESPAKRADVSKKKFAFALVLSIFVFLLTTYLGIIIPFAICVEIIGFNSSRTFGLILLLIIPFVIGLPCTWFVFRGIKQSEDYLAFFKSRGVRFIGRLLRAAGVWGLSFFGMACLLEVGPSSWSSRWIVFGTFNVPVLITLIRSYRLTEKQWDWCFLTFLILHANVVTALMFSEAWLPDIHFIRGLIFGQTFALVILGVCFLYRSIKRQMSIPLFVHYGLGIWASPLLFYAVFTQWVV